MGALRSRDTDLMITALRSMGVRIDEDGGDLVIDGKRVIDGDKVSLLSGKHMVSYQQGDCVKLWALDHVPKLPEGFPAGPIAGDF